MKLFIAFLLLCVTAFCQTRIDPSQVPWSQVDSTFWRQCIYASDGVTLEGFLYFGYSRQGATTIPWNQIANYGIKTSPDGTQLWVYDQFVTKQPRWTVTAVSTANGTLEYRGGWNLVGLQFTDISITGDGGWWTALNGGYPNPPLVSFTVTNGIFSVAQVNYYPNSCALWNIASGPMIKLMIYVLGG